MAKWFVVERWWYGLLWPVGGSRGGVRLEDGMVDVASRSRETNAGSCLQGRRSYKLSNTFATHTGHHELHTT